MSKKKVPLLTFLKNRYPKKEKEKLYAHILCGEVAVNGSVVRDPHMPVDISSTVILKKDKQFVSRGGEKLDYVLDTWDIDVYDKVVLDAGSSTGGFTDCVLKHGASIVYAVDVGYNQLAFSLRTDPRVKVMERTNIMTLSEDDLKPSPELAVMDLSFRSIRRAAYHVLTLLNGRYLVSLIKPQFEYRNHQFNFDGIVKTKGEVLKILTSLIKDLKSEGINVLRIDKSPILGRKGNREYFFYLSLAKENNQPLENTNNKKLPEQLLKELTRIVLE